MSIRIKVLYFMITAVLCAILLTIVMQLWHMDIDVPFIYAGDSHFTGVTIKNMIDNGWYLESGRLGGQFGFHLGDYPQAESINMLIIKVISLFTRNYGAIINIFFLLGFFASAFSALYVFLKSGYHSVLAIAVALLFAFMPYHFMRGVPHLFLSAYFTIPLIVYLVLSIMEVSDNLDDLAAKQGNIPHKLRAFGIVTCILVSSTGVYYAYFACFLILFAFIFRWIHDCSNHQRTSLWPIFYIVIICAGLVVNIIPNILYFNQNGINRSVVERSSVDSDVYGLKLINLVLPIIGHRFSLFNKIANRYLSKAVLVNENYFAANGIVASVGLVVSAGALLFANAFKTNQFSKKVRNISALTLVSFIMATIGGIGTIAAFYFFPYIRAYNRISIFIAFFSLLTVLDLIHHWVEKLNRRRANALLAALFVFLLCFGIFDQTSPNYVPDYAYSLAEFRNDERFIKKVESAVAEHALVFQLPYFPFPENGPINLMTDYDPLKGFLHSETIRWSYGVSKGREGDLWMKDTAAMPVDLMIDRLVQTGYEGIYIDRGGYKTKEYETLESSILNKTGKNPMISDNARLVYIPIK